MIQKQLTYELLMYKYQFNYFLQSNSEQIPMQINDIKYQVNNTDTFQYQNLLSAIQVQQNKILQKENDILIAKDNLKSVLVILHKALKSDFYFKVSQQVFKYPYSTRQIKHEYKPMP